MGVLHFSFKTVLFLTIQLLLAGCSAPWTGGIPNEYKHAGKFPVVAAVSGISELIPSQGSSDTALTENYMPTNEIILNTSITHGWVVQFQPVDRDLVAEEYYILPKAARWNCDTNTQTVSKDQTTCRTVIAIPKKEHFVSHDWGMFLDDPVGEYEMAVFIDHKLAVDFKFRVLAPSADGKK